MVPKVFKKLPFILAGVFFVLALLLIGASYFDLYKSVNQVKVLTPEGYKSVSSIKIGDQVIAYENGQKVTNKIENIEVIHPPTLGKDHSEFYLINKTYKLFAHQSVIVNDGAASHAFEVKIGDVLYNENNEGIEVLSIEKLSTKKEWFRLTVAGNHSYIADGLVLHNASRYWVGGCSTSNWNCAGGMPITTNWSATSGGAGGSTAPTSSDDVFFDSSSTSTSTLSASTTIKSLNATGYTNILTHNASVTLTIQGGDVTFVSGMTYTLGDAATSAITFDFSSVPADSTFTLTTNGKTLGNLTVDTDAAVNPTLSLGDDLTLSSTATLTLTRNTFTANNKNLNIGKFASSNSNTRTLTMGSGTWTLSGTGTVWDTGTTTGLTFSGNSATIKLTDTSATGRTISAGSLASFSSVWISAGTGTETFTGVTNVVNLDFTGFAGTGPTFPDTINGSLTLSSGMTMPSGSSTAITFAATSGTKTITSAGQTIDRPLTFNGDGGTWQLSDALLVGATRTVTLTTGTFNANNKNVTTGLFASSNANARTITMGSGTWTLSSTGTVWNLAMTDNLTLNRDTSTIAITDTSATGKTFAGGGKSYYNVSITASSSGTVTFQGNNTFNDFTINSPKTVTLTSSTTQTIQGTFSATGSSGNVITINSSATGTAATLSKSSGTVSADYLSLQDSAATGGATWCAGANSTDVSGNSGWVFAASPCEGQGGGGGGGGGGGSGGGPGGDAGEDPTPPGTTGIKVEKKTNGGDGTFDFTVTGPGYNNFSITTVGGLGSDTQASLGVGTYSVTETVPAGWAQESASCTKGTLNAILVVAKEITVCTITNAKNNPVPTTTSISPTSQSKGSPAFTLTVNGTNFISTSVVRFNNSDRATTHASATQLTADIPASDLTTAGTFDIAVFNPGPGGGTSNAQQFTVIGTFIKTISPASKLVGSAAFTLTVNGSNFSKQSVVRFNYQNRTTKYVSSTKLTASILASDLKTTGTYDVLVRNTATGEDSNIVKFKVNNPVPKISSIDPTSKLVGSGAFTLTVNGSNFVQTSVVRFAGSNRTTTFVSATQVTASILASDLKKAGKYNIIVFNPGPGGGSSGKATFTVDPTTPTQIIINKNTTGGDASFNFTVTGPTSFAKTVNTSSGAGSSGPTVVQSGETYAIAEEALDGWTFTSASCDKTFKASTNGVINVLVALGKTTTCTFTNTKVSVSEEVSPSPPPPNTDNDPGGETGGFGGGIIDFVYGIGPATGGFIQSFIENLAGKEAGEAIVALANETKAVIEIPFVALVTRVIETIGVAAGAVVTSVVIASSAPSLSSIFWNIARFFSTLLTAFGLKRRVLHWGVAYDSVTKQPLDPAYIALKNLKGKNVSSAITDIDGRYGFLVAPGIYQITANKTNYAFPSKKLAGKTQDEIYDNLYLGGEVEIKKRGEVIAKNIPLDPIKFDWNEFAKRNKNFMKFYSKWDLVIRKVSDWFFVLGFAVAIIIFLFAPHPYNIIIMGSYIILLILRFLGLKPKSFGYITERTTGFPLSFAVLRIMTPSNVEISHKVADEYGRYYCLVPKGKYYVKIEKKNDDGSYVLILTSPIINASKKGIIKERFKV